MIFKSSSPLSPSVEVAIDNVPVNYLTLQEITVEEKEGMHTVASLNFIGMDPQLIHQYIDVPIKFSIELRERSTFYFYGYIVYLEPMARAKDGVVNGSPFQITTVHCFGSSYIMKSLTSRVWESKTIAEIASSIADKYSFSFSVPNNPFRFTRLVQSSQSDWEFLVSTAKKLGYSTVMDGTHLQIWDPFSSLYRNISYSMLLTIRGSKGDVSPQPGQILNFEGRIGAITPDGARTPDTLHLLDKTGKLLSVENGTEFQSSGLATAVKSRFTNVLNTNVDSYDMGKSLVTGALRKKFPMTANLQIVADPSIHPGGIVNINEYNSEFDGFWYVVSVRHELTQSYMVTYLELARDSLGNTDDAQQVSVAHKTPPDPALINNAWVSSKDYSDVYV
jgi:hypothetical protein